MSITAENNGTLFRIDTDSCTYAFAVSPDGILCRLYFGAPLGNSTDLKEELDRLTPAGAPAGVGTALPFEQEYPVQEPFDYGSHAFCPVFPDGSRGTRLRFRSFTSGNDRLSVVLTDEDKPLTVTLHYRTEGGLIFRSTELRTVSEEPVRIVSPASAVWTLPSSGLKAVYYTGAWGREYTRRESPVTAARLTLSNSRGTCASHQAVPYLMLHDGACETHGEAAFFGLCWSGDFSFTAEETDSGTTRVSACCGCPEYLLTGDRPLTLPECFAGFSAEGFEGVSRMLYDWEFDFACPQRKIRTPRPVIYNSWYPCEFHVTEENCMAAARLACETGAELFVLDDGWMKGRTCDSAGLGDWFPDPVRFPRGLKPLAELCHSNGMLFGLWAEPEMVNPDSDLFRAHPEWILKDPGRREPLMRGQYVLDLTREDVCVWCIETLDRLITDYSLDYLKWDMNRYMTALGTDGEMRFRYIRSLYRIWDSMTRKHPDVLFENCASGGGRADFGMLPYADRINRSDNADPVDVIRINEHFTTLFLPCLAGGAGNISPSPNGINGRETPFSFRADCGMTGSMSIGVDLLKCSPAELTEIKEAVTRFKALRADLQSSYVLRLKSIEDGRISVLEYLRRDGGTVIVFAFGHGLNLGEGNIRVRLRSLDPTSVYRDESGVCLSGAALMHKGLPLALKGDFASRTIVFRRC